MNELNDFRSLRYSTANVQVRCEDNDRLTAPTDSEGNVVSPTDDLRWQARMRLDANSLERFDAFKRNTAGWNFGKGEPLSHHSIGTFEWFINTSGDVIHGTPSLFMTSVGNLELVWEDASGSRVALEFLAGKIAVYSERLDIDEEFVWNDVEFERLLIDLE